MDLFNRFATVTRSCGVFVRVFVRRCRGLIYCCPTPSCAFSTTAATPHDGALRRVQCLLAPVFAVYRNHAPVATGLKPPIIPPGSCSLPKIVWSSQQAL
jgi:hypothetical protein